MKNVLEISKKLIICIFILSISLIICMRSELNPIAKRVPTIDSDVYVYIAKDLNNGKVVYKDIFDHKGPLYHFIEYIGVKLSFDEYISLWIIEVIFMITTLSFLYKASKLVTKNRMLSALVIFASSISLSMFFINGNYTEEYALPFISISLYYIIKYFKEDFIIDRKIGILIGGCFGCVALIKLNLVTFWVVFILAIWIKLVYEKKWSEFRKTTTNLFIGAIIPILIAIIVLLIQNNLIDCFEQYIVFNLKYSTNKEGSLEDTITLFASPVFCISLVSCMIDLIYRIVSKKQEKKISIVSLIYLCFTFLIIIMPINEYRHYGIILTPAYILPLSLLLKDIYDIIKADKSKIRFIIMICILIYLIFNISRRDIVELKKELLVTNSERFIKKELPLTNFIKENTDSNDSILVLGNNCNIYLMSERFCNCKYVYQIPIVRIDNDIMKKTIDEIRKNKPKLIILNLTEYEEVQEGFYDYLEETDAYEKIEVFDTFNVYRVK